MSALVVLLCDAAMDPNGCPAEFGPDTPESTTRQFAHKAGWRSVGRSDFCPAHAAEADK